MPKGSTTNGPASSQRGSSTARASGPRPQPRARGARRKVPVSGLLLAPGAGASADHPSLLSIADAVTGSGLAVERMDFPYRLAGRRRPDPAPTLEAAVRAVATRFADSLGVGTGSLLLGGRSMGGRICSQVVGQDLPAAGLVLISYPLHPPGRPDRLRTGHFPHLHVPCLFVSGTRDAFGTPTELEAASSAIPGAVTHVWVEGGDHGLRKKEPEVASAVVAWLSRTFAVG